MSYKVDGTTITLTRGDTFTTIITIKYKDGTVYTPQEGDEISFALKNSKMTAGNKSFVDREPLISKIIPINTMVLELVPNDTKNLEFGKYKYDIQIIFGNGQVSTFISNADLILTPEVH